MAGGSGASEVVKEYAAGFAAGIATVATGHPFDTIKVRLQAHNTRGQVKAYRNAWHCTSQIFMKEGVRGLYRGASPVFIGMSFEGSLAFGIYSQMRQLLQGGEAMNGKPHLPSIIPSGACGGAAISFILCPTELVKCRMQVLGTQLSNTAYTQYTGPLDCALKTVKNEGIKGIFRGGMATFLRESIGNAVFFSAYEVSRHFMRFHLRSDSSSISREQKILTDVGIGIFSGGLAGTAFWCAVLPFDVAKTVIQTAAHETYSRNPFKELAMIYSKVGLRGCYAGLGPTLTRAFPTNAAAIVAWEFTAKLLGLERAKELYE